MENTTTRRKRSQKLTPVEILSIRRYVKDSGTVVEAATEIGIRRQTLVDIMIKKSCHPDTIAKINEAITRKSIAQ